MTPGRSGGHKKQEAHSEEVQKEAGERWGLIPGYRRVGGRGRRERGRVLGWGEEGGGREEGSGSGACIASLPFWRHWRGSLAATR